jgi:hypothetical protein
MHRNGPGHSRAGSRMRLGGLHAERVEAGKSMGSGPFDWGSPSGRSGVSDDIWIVLDWCLGRVKRGPKLTLTLRVAGILAFPCTVGLESGCHNLI